MPSPSRPAYEHEGSTYASFNVALLGFVQSLQTVFPERRTKLEFVQDALEVLAKADHKQPTQLFLQSLAPHAPLILSKDASLFTKPDLMMPGGLDLAAMWADEGLTESSRSAIWEHLHVLFMLASTASMPPELVRAIETMAGSAAAKVKAGGDFMSVANELVSSVLSNPSLLASALEGGEPADDVGTSGTSTKHRGKP